LMRVIVKGGESLAFRASDVAAVRCYEDVAMPQKATIHFERSHPLSGCWVIEEVRTRRDGWRANPTQECIVQTIEDFQRGTSE